MPTAGLPWKLVPFREIYEDRNVTIIQNIAHWSRGPGIKVRRVGRGSRQKSRPSRFWQRLVYRSSNRGSRVSKRAKNGRGRSVTRFLCHSGVCTRNSPARPPRVGDNSRDATGRKPDDPRFIAPPTTKGPITPSLFLISRPTPAGTMLLREIEWSIVAGRRLRSRSHGTDFVSSQ